MWDLLPRLEEMFLDRNSSLIQWYLGYMIANDIVGIVLKLEYDLSFSYLDDFTNNGNWGQTPFLLSSPLVAHFMCMRV